jgi:hypothetical protein
MARFDIVAPKTYATEANADKAVKVRGFDDLRYFIYKNWEDRYFPVFIGQPAIERGVHFHFNVVG